MKKKEENKNCEEIKEKEIKREVKELKMRIEH